MTQTSGTLAASLKAVFDYYTSSLTSDHDARTFERDWPANSRSLASALGRVGGPAWWLDREPYHADDRTPFVVASVDPSTGFVRFDVATEAETSGIAPAELFAWDGSRMPPE